jgi:hypothetical protein
MLNTQRSTSNAQRSTPNAQRSTSNAQRPKCQYGLWAFSAERLLILRPAVIARRGRQIDDKGKRLTSSAKHELSALDVERWAFSSYDRRLLLGQTMKRAQSPN